MSNYDSETREITYTEAYGTANPNLIKEPRYNRRLITEIETNRSINIENLINVVDKYMPRVDNKINFKQPDPDANIDFEHAILGGRNGVRVFKIGEAFLGRMSIIFYKEIGFSKGQIAIYSKGLGWITTVVFTLIGGVMAMRAGTIKTMFFAGGLMAITNLLFAVLAWTGKSELLFAVAVIADDITAAFATVAFVAFISLLVDRTYTATQYALLASIGTAGRTTLASSSGALVDWLNGDWGTFFVLTTIMVIPSLICLWMIKNKIKIGAK